MSLKGAFALNCTHLIKMHWRYHPENDIAPAALTAGSLHTETDHNQSRRGKGEGEQVMCVESRWH